jgi:hypothetical protein
MVLSIGIRILLLAMKVGAKPVPGNLNDNSLQVGLLAGQRC